MTPRPWIVHLSEETRALVHGVLTDAVEAVGNATSDWWPHGRGAISRIVAKAARLRIGRRGALFTIDRHGLRMVVPARGAPAREQMLLSGMLLDGDIGTGPNEVLLGTLAAWRDGLATPVAATTREEAQRFVRATALLGRGVAARLERPWSVMEVHVGDAGRHSVELGVSFAGPYEPLRFQSAARSAQDGSMSAALVEALDRLRGNGIHAAEWRPRHGDCMPDVHFGPPSPVWFLNDGDVIATMSAIAALPIDAELLIQHRPSARVT